MRRTRWMAVGLALASGVAIAAACSDSGGGSKPVSYAGKQASVMVEGGKAAALSLGAVKLDLPAGALSADTEVSVDVKAKTGHPDESKIAIDVYDFGPDGTSFEKPVKLEFNIERVRVGKGNKAVVAWLEDGKWQSLPTVVKDGRAAAETTHFTPYTVLILPDQTQQIGGQCAGADFTPCGGDLVGSWKFTAGCVTFPGGMLPDPGEQNIYKVCDEQPVARFDVDVSGTVNFGADGSFMLDQTTSVTGGIVVSSACLAQINAQGGGANFSCEELAGTPEGDDCVLGMSDGEPENNSSTGTYTTDGNLLNVMEDDAGTDYYPDDGGDFYPDDGGVDFDPDAGASDDTPAEYCVRGNSLTVRISESGGTVFIYTGTRQ